ncbi:MAG: FtsQ-type POTRA domain-containing protein [Deltaproteobacteria bacterium]|nr:FtsQ-type POTRA domain-containing protein [Candidatus Zymogenaceae bacterium]
MTRDLKDIGPSEFTVRNGKEKAEKDGATRKPKTLIAAVCALGLLGMLIYGAVRILPDLGEKIGESSYFRLEGVDVIGVVMSDRGEIGGAIGFAAGSPLLETDLVAIREQVEKIDWVKEAEVKRDFPNKLVITITEHAPVARTVTDEGRRFVDPDGELAAIDTDIAGLPTFLGMTTHDEYVEGARLLKLVSDNRLIAKGQVKTVMFDGVMGYSVLTGQGIEVRFGTPPFEEKVRRITEVLDDAQKRGPIRYIYLNIENRVVVKVGAPVM